jgi:hypothetical protein
VKLLWPRCSPRAAVRDTLSRRPATSRREHTEKPHLARPSPEGPKRTQIWARTAAPLGSLPPRHQEAAPPPPRHPAPPPPGRRAAATGTKATEGHRRQQRAPARRLPRARVRACPPPPAPHGALPGGLRRRRRREGRGRRSLAARVRGFARPRPRGTRRTKRFSSRSDKISTLVHSCRALLFLRCLTGIFLRSKYTAHEV